MRFILRSVVVAAVAVSAITPLHAFVMDTKRWDAGNITMHLNLDTSPLVRPLADGSTSWTQVAEQALSDWNVNLSKTKFVAVPNSSVAVGRQNGVNNVVWGSTVYGEAWGNGVVGVTITVSQSGTPGRRIESDVIFNNNIAFNSYRGALGSSGSTLDFKRVALHEFGHVLGLDHPDDYGQSKVAVMNSFVSDIDSLKADDIEGVQSAYGATISSSLVAPSIVSLSGLASATAGSNVTFSVVASGTAPFTYQWKKNSVAINGAKSANLFIESVQSIDSGVYSVTVTNSAGNVSIGLGSFTVSVSTPSIVSQPTSQSVNLGSSGSSPSVATAGFSQLTNVSVRTTLAPRANLIFGLTMAGGPKPVLVRAVGPGLTAFGVTGVMTDPTMAVYKDGIRIDGNDNWGGGASLSSSFSSVGAFPLPAASLDAALVRSIDGGNSVHVSSAQGGTVLVEAYDAGSSSSTRLINLSARNQVGTGADALIAGFTVSGNANKTVLIRGIGPTLASFGVAGTLADPKLELYAGGTKVGENDTWSASLSSTFATVGAFGLIAGSKDAALIVTLPPGGYTVQLTGNDGGVGEGMIEIYEIEN